MADVLAVLWDADGVLQQPAFGWRSVYADLGGVPEDFIAQVWAVEEPLMVGGDFPEAVRSVATAQGLDHPLEDLLAPWRSIELLEGSLDVVRRVRAAGVASYLATNQQPYRGAFMQDSLGYDDQLDGAFYSYELGLAKPDPAFFRRILDALSLTGEQVLFVDDRQDNVDGATAAGLRAERWRNDEGVASLLARLARNGVTV